MGPCSSEDRRVLDFSSVTHSTGNQRSSRTGECRKEVEPSIVKTVKARTHVGFFKLTFYLPLQWWWMYSYFLYITYNTYFTFASSLYCVSLPSAAIMLSSLPTLIKRSIYLSSIEDRTQSKIQYFCHERIAVVVYEWKEKKEEPTEWDKSPTESRDDIHYSIVQLFSVW